MTLKNFGDLASEIAQNILPTEREADAETLVELLGFSRALARLETPDRAHFEFAGKILCVLLDPLKPPQFRDAAVRRRTSHVGIADSRQHQVQFTRSMRPFLFIAASAEDAYRAGFDNLFDDIDANLAPGRYTVTR